MLAAAAVLSFHSKPTLVKPGLIKDEEFVKKSRYVNTSEGSSVLSLDNSFLGSSTISYSVERLGATMLYTLQPDVTLLLFLLPSVLQIGSNQVMILFHRGRQLRASGLARPRTNERRINGDNKILGREIAL